MRARVLRTVAPGVGLLALLAIPGTPRAKPGKPPRVDRLWEGRSPGDSPILVLEGQQLKTVADAFLRTPEGDLAGWLGVISPGSTTVSFTLPAGLPPGEYDLVALYGEDSAELVQRVILSGGKALAGTFTPESVSATLKEDLDDAASLGRLRPERYRDAGVLDAGSLSTDRFSAMPDLEAEGVFAGGSLVTDRFSAWEDLVDEGAVGEDGNLSPSLFSAWADLLAEGKVEGSGLLGTAFFSSWAELADEGRRGPGGGLAPGLVPAWDDLLAEGKLDGDGRLQGGLFSAWADLAAEGKVGMASGKVAPGVHDHDGHHAPLSGATLTGPLTVDGGTNVSSGDGAIQLDGKVPWIYPGGTGLLQVYGFSTGVAVGVRAECASPVDGSAAMLAEGPGFSPLWGQGNNAETGASVGVSGLASATTGTTYGILAESTGSRRALLAGPESRCKVTLKAETKGGAGAALQVRSAGTSGSIATFTDNTTSPEVRIDGFGTGLFNGGTQTGGADFAESVAVDRPAGSFEPGDVLVVDPASPRGFALCGERESRLVAGVVSARPAVLATRNAVASSDRSWEASEVAMGIAGIVPVKVCDENGPVRPGDLLVTASLPGHAMRAPARPRPGTVLGKALGRLEEGRGRVEALLTIP